MLYKAFHNNGRMPQSFRKQVTSWQQSSKKKPSFTSIKYEITTINQVINLYLERE